MYDTTIAAKLLAQLDSFLGTSAPAEGDKHLEAGRLGKHSDDAVRGKVRSLSRSRDNCNHYN